MALETYIILEYSSSFLGLGACGLVSLSESYMFSGSLFSLSAAIIRGMVSYKKIRFCDFTEKTDTYPSIEVVMMWSSFDITSHDIRTFFDSVTN